MKNILLGLLLCTFAFISSNAQDKGGPKIEMQKEVHDYGTIENGADGTCIFKFKNTGQSDLVISNCRASCGCTVPSWSRDPIKPGKTGSIKVKYDTKRTGPINKAVTITSNAVNAPSKIVRIKGTVKPKVIATTRDGMIPTTKGTVGGTKMNSTKAVPVAKAKPVSTKKWYQFWKKK